MRKIKSILLFLICIVGLAACGGRKEANADIYQVYYVSNTETKVEMHEHAMEGATVQEKLDELIECLSTTPEKLEYKAPLAMGFSLLDVSLEEERVQLNVNAAYKDMPPTTEVLVRAAIVRTLTQIPEISYVGITVEGEQLYDNLENPVGWMSADEFIDNNGSEINTYELVRVSLYFANETGDSLIATYREKYYSTNTPLERFVVEELIAGPSGQIAGVYPSVNPDTTIINVMTRDGICYVNLSESFLTVVNNVPTEISIYSIVNSLVELSTVNRVQILINGEVPPSFGSAVFERNLDMVTTLER
nr:GerMN domain-containing protein [uncultured Acetatifactor sp.]